MTDATDPTVPATAESPTSAADARAGRAGALLRAARQQQGMHIAVLAASIKVTPAKLEALEAGRYHELPDATFTRALALTICRVLKIDPTPVLAELPGTPPDALGRVDGGLNMPFREYPGRIAPADWAPWRHPVLWLVALLLVAAAAFVLVPSTTQPDLSTPAAPGAAEAPVLPAVVVTEPAAGPAAVVPGAGPASAAAGVMVAPLTAPAPQPAASGAAAVVGADTLILRALQDTWVQAVDGNGQTLMARLVPAGETVALTPALPVRLRIGNARGTELRFRDQPVELKTSDNIANLTLP